MKNWFWNIMYFISNLSLRWNEDVAIIILGVLLDVRLKNITSKENTMQNKR